jgi:hypothetical protein
MDNQKEFLLMKALNFKYMGGGNLDAVLEGGLLDEEQAEKLPIKNVCAKLAIPLVDELEEVCGILDITKRAFIESALISAIAQFRDIAEEHDIFAPHTPKFPSQTPKGDQK